MARILRLLANLLVVAASLAPPVAVPPPVQSPLPVVGVATQTFGSYAGSAAAPMPIADAAAPPLQRVGALPPIAPAQSSMSEGDLMSGLRNSQASPNMDAWSTVKQLHLDDRFVTTSVYSSLKLVSVFFLAAASAVAALEWSRRRRTSDVMDDPFAELELGILNEKFAVAGFAGASVKPQAWDPLGLHSKSTASTRGRRTQMHVELDGSGLLPAGPLAAYADALIDIAAKKGESVQVTKDVMKIRTLYDDEAFCEQAFVLINDYGMDHEKAPKLLGIMGEWESTVMPGFIRYLGKKQRLKAVKPIADFYIDQIYKKQSIAPVVVESATKLTDAQADQVTEKMKAKLGCADIKLVQVVNGDLLGGMVVTWGFLDPDKLETPTESIDLSMKAIVEKATLKKGVIMA